MTSKTAILALAGAAGLALTAASAQAQTITSTDGKYTAGISNQGEVYNSGVGLSRNSDGFDPIAAGIGRDSWGVSTNLGYAYADASYYGLKNTTSVQSVYAGSAAVTISSSTIAGLFITQTFTFLQSNVLVDYVTLLNNSGAALTDVQFQRNVDFDVAPTAFNENTFANSITGPTDVVDSSYNGFENPNPQIAYSDSCAAGCNQTGDVGAGIKVSVGTIAAGGSASFEYFYGDNQTGQDVNGLISQVVGDGANYWVATQSSENGAYPLLGSNSAILAVEAVPEPSTWAMLGLGFAGLGFAGYRGRKSRGSVAIAL
ncbi:putative secreted protein with PEP-CTERM sorting signal [Roseiarcus fermentans]|uniref:Putative secreted protein with PEP-CTERM sorting signal n=1 Tax=Roseiarcus fermentans TaxID=1473586 RepID=A0A366EMJ7_9HYPH|nr:PEP-CTERM sorting domain-containing protein [Roseiarcus fermentans]RBP03494.1 putative secreted protein with PEP-CTERM sorting signal [Roseiarcus fermentans]